MICYECMPAMRGIRAARPWLGAEWRRGAARPVHRKFGDADAIPRMRLIAERSKGGRVHFRGIAI